MLLAIAGIKTILTPWLPCPVRRTISARTCILVPNVVLTWEEAWLRSCPGTLRQNGARDAATISELQSLFLPPTLASLIASFPKYLNLDLGKGSSEKKKSSEFSEQGGGQDKIFPISEPFFFTCSNSCKNAKKIFFISWWGGSMSDHEYCLLGLIKFIYKIPKYANKNSAMDTTHTVIMSPIHSHPS